MEQVHLNGKNDELNQNLKEHCDFQNDRNALQRCKELADTFKDLLLCQSRIIKSLDHDGWKHVEEKVDQKTRANLPLKVFEIKQSV